MQEWNDFLCKNKIYDYMELLGDQKVLKNKWVFKSKNNKEKEVKYKVPLVVKGLEQK